MHRRFLAKRCLGFVHLSLIVYLYRLYEYMTTNFGFIFVPRNLGEGGVGGRADLAVLWQGSSAAPKGAGFGFSLGFLYRTSGRKPGRFSSIPKLTSHRAPPPPLPRPHHTKLSLLEEQTNSTLNQDLKKQLLQVSA